jgi:hypothetical protein
VIPIVKPDLEQAVRQQSHADHRRKQSDVFAKEPAPLDLGWHREGGREPSRWRWYPSHDSANHRARRISAPHAVTPRACDSSVPHREPSILALTGLLISSDLIGSRAAVGGRYDEPSSERFAGLDIGPLRAVFRHDSSESRATFIDRSKLVVSPRPPSVKE